MTGQEVRRIRRTARLTQAEFAHFLGITMNTVWRWEHSEHLDPLPEKAILWFQATYHPGLHPRPHTLKATPVTQGV